MTLLVRYFTGSHFFGRCAYAAGVGCPSTCVPGTCYISYLELRTRYIVSAHALVRVYVFRVRSLETHGYCKPSLTWYVVVHAHVTW